MTTSTCLPSSSSKFRAVWLFSDRNDGDFGNDLDDEQLRAKCRSAVDLPWTLLAQVHGSDVVVVDSPGDGNGSTADAAVTATPGAVLAVRTADCAGVVLVGYRHDRPSDDSLSVVAVGVAHAGWKGLEQGVLQNTVAAMRTLGAEQVHSELGPCISPQRYEFGESELNRLVERYGDPLRQRTSAGTSALDLRAGVRAAMEESGATTSSGVPPCTASGDQYFSWRARAERGRQIAAIWMEPEDSPKFYGHRSTIPLSTATKLPAEETFHGQLDKCQRLAGHR